jgi:hypothetical protein
VKTLTELNLLALTLNEGAAILADALEAAYRSYKPNSTDGALSR